MWKIVTAIIKWNNTKKKFLKTDDDRAMRTRGIPTANGRRRRAVSDKPSAKRKGNRCRLHARETYPAARTKKKKNRIKKITCKYGNRKFSPTVASSRISPHFQLTHFPHTVHRVIRLNAQTRSSFSSLNRAITVVWRMLLFRIQNTHSE